MNITAQRENSICALQLSDGSSNSRLGPLEASNEMNNERYDSCTSFSRDKKRLHPRKDPGAMLHLNLSPDLVLSPLLPVARSANLRTIYDYGFTLSDQPCATYDLRSTESTIYDGCCCCCCSPAPSYEVNDDMLPAGDAGAP